MIDYQHLSVEEEQRLRAQLRSELAERMMRLDDAQLALLAAECAEHVLHLYEAWYPDDARVSEAIRVAKAAATGAIEPGTIVQTAKNAVAAAREAEKNAQAAEDRCRESTLAEDVLYRAHMTGASLAAAASVRALMATMEDAVANAFGAVDCAAVARGHTVVPGPGGGTVQRWRCAEEYAWQLVCAGGPVRDDEIYAQ